jgi:2-keto-4-pentenoate hydratase/2-oxohepta-3-ene-1,7-dioic acid hydratase in catechol pathway
MTMGKSLDTHGPMGPWLVTPDEVGDVVRIEIEKLGAIRSREPGRRA